MPILRSFVWGAAFVTLLLSGCSIVKEKPDLPTASSGPDEVVQPVSSMEEVGSKESVQDNKSINITPLSAYKDEWSFVTSAPKDVSFSNSYTRLLIYSDIYAANGQENGDTIPLKYQPRTWLRRAIVGRVFSINLTTNVSVGDFETTVPLATVGHESNSEGEKWNRVIHHSKSNFPLFLVKSDGSASVPVVKISVNGTKSYSSRGAAGALQVALGVAQATTQSASVVTRLSEQSTRDKARAIDDAISQLFASGITEEHWTDRDLRMWQVGEGMTPNGVKVEFTIPKDDQDWNSEPLSVGTWTITFDFPRPSIFSDWRICPTKTISRCTTSRTEAESKILTDINASEVLNYVLVNNDPGLGTIRAFISQQDWYLSSQTALAKLDGTGNPTTLEMNKSTANAFCRRIANEITGIGLNGFDANIVVWAIIEGMPMQNGSQVFESASDCKNSIDPIKAEKDKKSKVQGQPT